MRIVTVDATATHDLRRRVLRDGDPGAEVVWPGDDDRGTDHLAALDDEGRIVAVSTWLTSGDEVQLRGMATEPDLRGTGIGAALLAAGLERSRARGAVAVWANARVEALDFYRRAGFEASGPVYSTEDTGLPHRRIRRSVGDD